MTSSTFIENDFRESQWHRHKCLYSSYPPIFFAPYNCNCHFNCHCTVDFPFPVSLKGHCSQVWYPSGRVWFLLPISKSIVLLARGTFLPQSKAWYHSLEALRFHLSAIQVAQAKVGHSWDASIISRLPYRDSYTHIYISSYATKANSEYMLHFLSGDPGYVRLVHCIVTLPFTLSLIPALRIYDRDTGSFVIIRALSVLINFPGTAIDNFLLHN